MRFWIKMAGMGVIGYLMFCLFPIPADYNTLMRDDAIFERLSSGMLIELSATGNVSAATRARLQEAFDRRAVAFAQWNDDLKRLGIG